MTFRETHNSLPLSIRQQTYELLAPLLSSTIDGANQAKHAHWNVTGMHFQQLHELFDTVAGTLFARADALAERITALGATADGRTSVTAQNSFLDKYPEAANAEEHLHALAAVLSALSSHARTSAAQLSEAGDEASADLLVETVREADYSLWLLEAHIA